MLEHWYYVAELVLALMAIIGAILGAGRVLLRAITSRFKALHASIEVSDTRTTEKIDLLRDHVDERFEDFKKSVEVVANDGHATDRRVERLTGRFEEHIRGGQA